ncbi:MAG: glycosyltransferase family 4 protein [Candidatus Schekmanbacteria bacterium]|nr:glycosyltransferase family 4 protein [Candidatus Schekmanbacteria bacterium]
MTSLVAFDARRCIPQGTGVAAYVAELLTALLEIAGTAVLVVGNAHTRELLGRDRRLQAPAGHLTAPCSPESHPWSELWELLHLRPELRRRECALFHSPAFVLPPLPAGVRTVVTIHDLAVFQVPDCFPRRFAAYLRHCIRRSVSRADLVFADTEAVAGELRDRLAVPASRIAVAACGVPEIAVPTAAEVAATRAQLRLPERYVLHVGTIERRKNLVRLLQAVKELRARGWDGAVVLAGADGVGARDVRAAARALDGAAIFPGYVDRIALAVLYQGCACVVLPSVYEGFGLPLLEAFAMGAPVCASAIPAFREVAGDAAAFFPPDSAAAMASVLSEVLARDVLRKELSGAGCRRLRHFSWRATAARVHAGYEQLLKP